MPLLLLALPIISTLTGGLLAIHLRRHMAILTACGAGLLLGASFLDLLPEAMLIGAGAGIAKGYVMALTLLSFLLFHAVERALDGLGQRIQNADGGRDTLRRSGAALLIFHSFRDGMAIGAAFAASHGAGYAVTFGIAAHDLGDGMNTVVLTTDGRAATRSDYGFLLADAAAPFLGGVLTLWWGISQVHSVLLLVLAAGFFLQIVTGEFIPDLRRTQTSRQVLVAAFLSGAAFIYVANLLIAGYR